MNDDDEDDDNDHNNQLENIQEGYDLSKFVIPAVAIVSVFALGYLASRINNRNRNE